MKSFTLVFALAVATFFDISAMQPDHFNNKQSSVPVILYKVNVQPPVEVLQIPSKEKVCLGGISAKSINMSCKEYNGIKIQAPIDIRYDMTRDQIGQSLCSTFGVDSVEFREGLIPTKTFSKMFPFL